MFKILQDLKAGLYFGQFQLQPLHLHLSDHSLACVASTYWPGTPCQPIWGSKEWHKVSPFHGFPKWVYWINLTKLLDLLQSFSSVWCVFILSIMYQTSMEKLLCTECCHRQHHSWVMCINLWFLTHWFSPRPLNAVAPHTNFPLLVTFPWLEMPSIFLWYPNQELSF